MDIDVNEVVRTFVERGDLAHVALLLWALVTTTMLAWSLRELAAANRRFNDFVQEIAHFIAKSGDEE